MFNLINSALAANASDVHISFVDGTLGSIINTVITWVLGIAGVIAVIYLIYGGILYITAAGDAEKATKGRTALVNAIIGIVIIALAVLIATTVTRILGGDTTV